MLYSDHHIVPKWKMCDANGLCLEDVEVWSYEDPTRLMHPELPHDEVGKIVGIGTPMSVEGHVDDDAYE